jgi:hypothetical protein
MPACADIIEDKLTAFMTACLLTSISMRKAARMMGAAQKGRPHSAAALPLGGSTCGAAQLSTFMYTATASSASGICMAENCGDQHATTSESVAQPARGLQFDI